MRPCGIVAQWLKIPKISILFPKKTSKYPGIIQDEKIFARYLLELVIPTLQKLSPRISKPVTLLFTRTSQELKLIFFLMITDNLFQFRKVINYRLKKFSFSEENFC